MQIPDSIINLFFAFLPALFIFAVFSTALWGIHWILIGRHSALGKERKFPIQILMLALTLVGILAVVIALPISESFRNQIIGLIGILISGIIAFSSTSIVGNFMAGILLRITKPFRTGDFIQVGDYFGRVSERGLFDTEIQSVSRELIALPNTYLVNTPVSTTRTSGAVVSTTLSLGYDIHYSQVEPLLISAATQSGLKDAFLHILELGNHSITYRISGLLEEVKGLVTARSNLCKAVLDTLHNQGVEIMSPNFVTQRRLVDDQKIIPTQVQIAPERTAVGAEEIVFDKAEQAEKSESEKQELIESIKELESSLKEAKAEEKDRLKAEMERHRERLKSIEQAENAPKPEGLAKPVAPADPKTVRP